MYLPPVRNRAAARSDLRLVDRHRFGLQQRNPARCYWKVHVWDRDGNPSAWSEQAFWTTGLLSPADWTAQSISDPVLADPDNRPRRPVRCYRSELAARPDAAKWIVLDLGESKRIDAVELIPARPPRQRSDFRTAMLPVRFKVEAADGRRGGRSGVAAGRLGASGGWRRAAVHALGRLPLKGQSRLIPGRCGGGDH